MLEHEPMNICHLYFMDLRMYESGWFCASYNSYICSYYIFIRFEIEPAESTDLGTHALVTNLQNPTTYCDLYCKYM